MLEWLRTLWLNPRQQILISHSQLTHLPQWWDTGENRKSKEMYGSRQTQCIQQRGNWRRKSTKWCFPPLTNSHSRLMPSRPKQQAPCSQTFCWVWCSTAQNIPAVNWHQLFQPCPSQLLAHPSLLTRGVLEALTLPVMLSNSQNTSLLPTVLVTNPKYSPQRKLTHPDPV